MTLEQAIIRALEGGVIGITLFQTAKGWQASTKREGGSGWNVRVASTPVEALLLVLGVSAMTNDVEQQGVFG